MELLTELVRDAMRDAPPGPFQPVAFYHKELDEIVAVARDCSYSKVSICIGVSILEDNYAETWEVREIGVVVCDARAFCKKRGLVVDGSVKFVALLDAIAAEFPIYGPQIGRIARYFGKNQRVAVA